MNWIMGQGNGRQKTATVKNEQLWKDFMFIHLLAVAWECEYYMERNEFLLGC